MKFKYAPKRVRSRIGDFRKLQNDYTLFRSFELDCPFKKIPAITTNKNAFL